VLNRYDRPPPMAGEAEVKFLDGDFRIVRPGAFVRCAVTGVPIPLEELKYWSVDFQEAYASPEAVMRRLSSQPANSLKGRPPPRRVRVSGTLRLPQPRGAPAGAAQQP
jgi:hypothetical protein